METFFVCFIYTRKTADGNIRETEINFFKRFLKKFFFLFLEFFFAVVVCIGNKFFKLKKILKFIQEAV